jgi:hypothetical protein
MTDARNALERRSSLRVAVASSGAASVDGHFGSCAVAAERAADRMEARVDLIRDCHLLYVQSIGGPAAARVVRAGVHPVRFPAGPSAEEALERLRGVLDAPPPWLGRVLGISSPALARLEATWHSDGG